VLGWNADAQDLEADGELDGSGCKTNEAALCERSAHWDLHIVAWPPDDKSEPLPRKLADSGEGAEKAEAMATLHVVVGACRSL
jgi:hypothetical protein